jgi:hypothetical protein
MDLPDVSPGRPDRNARGISKTCLNEGRSTSAPASLPSVPSGGTSPICRRIARWKRVLRGAVDQLVLSLAVRGNAWLVGIARTRVAALGGSILFLRRPAFLSVAAVLVLVIDRHRNTDTPGGWVGNESRSLCGPERQDERRVRSGSAPSADPPRFGGVPRTGRQRFGSSTSPTRLSNSSRRSASGSPFTRLASNSRSGTGSGGHCDQYVTVATPADEFCRRSHHHLFRSLANRASMRRVERVSPNEA